jgi:hypothetical protein
MTTTIAPALGHAPLFTQAGTGTSPGYDAIDRRRANGVGRQEGVMDIHCFEVTQRAAGATQTVDIAANQVDALGSGVAALVQGDAVTAQGLYPVPPHTAVINEAVTAANATNPRIDQVVLELKDTTHDATGSNLVQTRVVAGTPTVGATLNNRTGAAALPASALLLADILVPAASSSVTNANIRDRRKWAQGAYCRIARLSNAAAGNDYSITSTTMAGLDATNVKPRIECSGAPLRVRLLTTLTATGTFVFSPQIDGVGMDGMANDGGSSATQSLLAQSSQLTADGLEWVTVPTAGSHLIYPAFAVSVGGNTLTIRAQAAAPLLWIVEEILGQNTANNPTTTG